MSVEFEADLREKEVLGQVPVTIFVGNAVTEDVGRGAGFPFFFGCTIKRTTGLG